MYPFASRLKWLLSGQWGHLLAALDRQKAARKDTVLAARITSLRFWNRVRSVVMVLLSLGLVATGLAWFADHLPGAREAEEATNVLATTLSSATGVMTLVYLFMTRLLSQIETDIWSILVVEKQ